jgi:hypothetical protein
MHAQAIIACVRKIAIYANAVLAKDQLWEKRHP